MFDELKNTWNLINEELKNPFYSAREAFHDRHKHSSQIVKGIETENPYISYDPFGLYTSMYLGAQNSTSMTYGDLVKKWRDVSMYPEVDEALNEIVSEAVVYDEIDQPISLNLDELELTDNIKQRIKDSFDNILYLLDFNEKGDELFRQWYVDATLNFEVVYNNRKLKDGIQKLILLPPYDIQKYKNEQTSEIRWYINKHQTFNSTKDLENAEITYFDEQITQINSGILSPDKRLYFSPLQKAMKAINQLYTIEDSMIIMRLTKSTEKRAFYIDTGNLPKSKAEEYIKGLINKYRQKKVYNTETGTVDNNQKSISLLEDFWFPVNACLDLKTKIKLLDGRDLELDKIIEEFNSGNQLWTYSCSPEGEIVPGKISWAGVTRKDANVIKVILDNDEEIICTPDHNFFMRDGSEKEAQYLTPNDSLMPIYMSEKNINNQVKKTFMYPTVKNNKTEKYEFVHKLVTKNIIGDPSKTDVIHHIDMDRKNNDPSNLEIMDKVEHIKLHSSMGVNSWKNSDYEEHCTNISKSIKQLYTTARGKEIAKQSSERLKNLHKNNPELVQNGWKIAIENRKILKLQNPELYKEKYNKPNKSKVIFTDELFQCFYNIILINYNKKMTIQDVIFLLKNNKDFINEYEKISFGRSIDSIGLKTIYKLLNQFNYSNFINFMKTNFSDYHYSNQYNHKVKEIVKLDYKLDTGTLRIDDNHEFHNYHNYALASGIFVMNSGRGTKVENLPGISNNFTSFEDVDYFLNKVYNALSIPNNRRNKDTRVTISTNLDIEKDELRFFKLIQKLRRKFNNLFVDLLKKDLIAKQVLSLDDWIKIQEKIKFVYSTSNEISMIKKAQINQIKVDGANAAVGLASPDLRIISPRYIQENIMRLTEEEINKINSDWINFGGVNAEDGQGVDALGNMPTGGGGGAGVPGYSEVGAAGAGVGPEAPTPTQPPPTETPEATKPRFSQRVKENSLGLNQEILDQLEDGDIITNGKDKILYENGKFKKI